MQQYITWCDWMKMHTKERFAESFLIIKEQILTSCNQAAGAQNAWAYIKIGRVYVK